jgi:hypothetical protein
LGAGRQGQGKGYQDEEVLQMAAHKSQILLHFLGIQADTFQVNLAESWTCGSTPAPASA